ncbi:MAG: hypothetical protein QMD10_09020 [Desulfitobacteriaceae bacterium]|nr:hypothetical protein [Desulfitobacteriaceae bacterium]
MRAAKLAKILKQGSKPLSEGNFAHNLTVLTKQLPEGMEAHHVLPKALADKFKRFGIENVHDPKYGAWVKGGKPGN